MFKTIIVPVSVNEMLILLISCQKLELPVTWFSSILRIQSSSASPGTLNWKILGHPIIIDWSTTPFFLPGNKSIFQIGYFKFKAQL